MKLVYANAQVIITADAAEDSQGGCFLSSPGKQALKISCPGHSDGNGEDSYVYARLSGYRNEARGEVRACLVSKCKQKCTTKIILTLHFY